MKIRIARDAEDSRSASSIYARSWKAGYRGIFSEKLLEEIPIDFWVKAFDSNYTTHRFEVAILNDGEADVGAGGYGLSRDAKDAQVGEIASLYFLETAWGRGYAGKLMDFMVHALKSRGCKVIHLWVLQENARAQGFYAKYGF